MKFIITLMIVVVMASLGLGHPQTGFDDAFDDDSDDTIFEFSGEDQSHQQSGEPGRSVRGEYRWTSPEGDEYYVKYVADEDGFRITDSNVVPETHSGEKADGNQVNFSDEYSDDAAAVADDVADYDGAAKDYVA